MKLPESHKQFTDKYFLRTKTILEKEELNPYVGIKVFARGEGEIAGIDEAIEILTTYSDIQRQGGEVWVPRSETYKTKDPLLVIKAPVQEVVELETMYLGVLSDKISEAAGIERPTERAVVEKLERLVDIYEDIPITYFGARHYHWSLDEMIGRAALKGGAVQTSTDIGSQSISQPGVGTTPHILTLMLSYKYGKEDATLKTAELFDKYVDPAVTRITLIDTFNKELTDSLAVAQYFGARPNFLRIDTCGENVGEGGTPHLAGKDPTYQTGTGVTLELVHNTRNMLIREGYGETTNLILTSSMGNEPKARAFMEAHKQFKDRTGYDLFKAVGIGETVPAIFTTADVFEVEGIPYSKTGREATIDYTTMRRVI